MKYIFLSLIAGVLAQAATNPLADPKHGGIYECNKTPGYVPFTITLDIQNSFMVEETENSMYYVGPQKISGSLRVQRYTSQQLGPTIEYSQASTTHILYFRNGSDIPTSDGDGSPCTKK